MKKVKRFLFIVASSFSVNFILLVINIAGLIFWRETTIWWNIMSVFLNISLCFLTANIFFERTYLKENVLRKRKR